MARKKAPVLTEGEERVMRVLWKKGEASVREVTQALEASHPTAYTTILTVLRVLTDKGYVKPRREGRADIYAPIVSRADARTAVLKQVLKQFFDGSPEVLARHLLDTTDLSLEEVEAIQSEIDKTAKPQDKQAKRAKTKTNAKRSDDD
ncbi:MAG: BlaI/MecI/CopY family transcriptional regulator [Maricaulaceae bacterium]|jgi:predicted transcriptional regulator